MAENDDRTEQRAARFAEAQGGLQFNAGHRVVLVVSDVKGSVRRRRDGGGEPAKTPVTAPGRKTLRGAFRVGDHAVSGATFRLHKDRGDGPLMTPDTLAGGKTDLRWAGDHWVAGDDGKYRFTDLPEGTYFVELFAEPEAAEP